MAASATATMAAISIAVIPSGFIMAASEQTGGPGNDIPEIAATASRDGSMFGFLSQPKLAALNATRQHSIARFQDDVAAYVREEIFKCNHHNKQCWDKLNRIGNCEIWSHWLEWRAQHASPGSEITIRHPVFLAFINSEARVTGLLPPSCIDN